MSVWRISLTQNQIVNRINIFFTSALRGHLHRSRIRYLSKKFANFNKFSEITKKIVKIRTKIR